MHTGKYNSKITRSAVIRTVNGRDWNIIIRRKIYYEE